MLENAKSSSQNEAQPGFETSNSGSMQLKAVSPLQSAANNSPQVQQLKQYQSVAANGPVQLLSNGNTPVQRAAENITPDQEATVMDRANAVKPAGVASGDFIKNEEINDAHGSGAKDSALVSREASSMAANPGFEAAAIQWESKFGGVAYNDDRAISVVDSAAKVAVDYLKAKHGEWNAAHADLGADLATIGIDSKGWSGGVGKKVEDVMEALTTGSLGVKIAHFENFANNILATDILDMKKSVLDGLLAKAGVAENDAMNQGVDSVKKSGSKYAFNVAEGDAADQWHMRARRNDKANSDKNASERTVGEVEGTTGMKISAPEKKFMETEKDTDKLPWEEGARVWALNERDKWVYAMRSMSLPLQAGVSGTTARMMQAFKKLGVGNPADNRLACIGYLLPTRHHSLVEIMSGAAGNGGPAFTPEPSMYRKIAPFTESELLKNVGPFPDSA